MIVYYKNNPIKIKRLIPSTTTKVHRRKKILKKLTERNKDFLKALGFKV